MDILIGKVRKHWFLGFNPTHCEKCGAAFSSPTHK
jgi:hypothetical protein